MENPFKFGGVVRGPFFADRGEEIAELSREMHNGGRVFLVSPRRYGKTCLLFNLMERLEREGVAAAYVDLNACPDLRRFVGTLGSRIASALESNTDRLIKLLASLKRLRPKVTVGHDGAISAGVEVTGDENDLIPALLEAISQAESLSVRKGRRAVVIFDEFSDVEKYDGVTVEKALRSEIQRHANVGYIFAGSQQSLLLAMIRDEARPFYRLGRTMPLGPIPRPAYREFILEWLRKGGMTCPPEFIDTILGWADDTPYLVQRLCHLLWEAGLHRPVITAETLKSLPGIVVRQDAPHYEVLWQTVTAAQRQLLLALAKDMETPVFSKRFQLAHRIGPASSIKAHITSLVKKAILYRDPSGRYRFTDAFFPRWLGAIQRVQSVRH